MTADDLDRTAKARQVRLEKRTVEDVLQALEDLVSNELDLGPPADVDDLGPAVRKALATTALPTGVHPELWDTDIPVLRDVVVPPAPSAPEEGLGRPDPRQMRDVVRRAVAIFNNRLSPGQQLAGTAVDLLEHLLFEEWVRTTTTRYPETHHE